MIMIYYLFVTFFLAYEIQKLVQLHFFFRLQSILVDYPDKVATKVNSVLSKEVIRVGFTDLFCLAVNVIGLFTPNIYFFASILFINLLYSLLFRTIRNKKFRKILYITTTLLTITLLLLSIVNVLFYHLNSMDFIKKIINYV